MSEAEFKQEYEADFNIYEGQVWNFDHEKCVINCDGMETHQMDIFAGLDVGYEILLHFVSSPMTGTSKNTTY